MPRNTQEGALKTRAAIVERATDVASADGLEGVTIGRLAADLSMSKAGVIGHFGSKEELQLAALDRASREFTRDVWEPAARKPEGIERLIAIADNWVAHTARPAFPGGCFWTAASVEWDSREGAVREALRRRGEGWRETIRREVRVANAAGESDADPDQVVYELYGLAMGLNQELRLFGVRKAQACGRARNAMHRALGRV